MNDRHAECPAGLAGEAMLAAQPGPHRRQQRVAAGQRQVVDRQLQRVGAPTGRPAHDHRLRTPAAQRDQRRLGARRIDRVDHDRLRRHEQRHIVGIDEVVDPFDPAVGRDVEQTIAHHRDFRRAQRGAQRVHLTVQIGLGDVIEVDQGQVADAGAGQRLGGPRTDAADPHHAHMRGAQPRQAGVAEHPGDAAERALRPVVIGRGRHRIGRGRRRNGRIGRARRRHQGMRTVEPVVRRDSRS